MDNSPTGFSVHGILQTRILEWDAISFSSGSSWTWDPTCIYCIGRQILYHCPTWEAWSMKGRKEIGTDSSWTITEATLKWTVSVSTVLGGAPGGQEDTELSSPRSTSGSHLLITHDTSRKPPPHQDCKEPSPRSWVGREEKLADQDWAPGRAPDEKGRTGAQRSSLERPMHTMHWAQQPWHNPEWSRPHCCCEPRGTCRRPRNLTTLLRHIPAPAPGTGWGGDQMLPRTWRVLLGSPCAPQHTNDPLAPLDPVHSPWGKGRPCWAKWAVAGKGLAQTSRMSGWGRVAIREGPEEQCSGNTLLHFPHSKVL